MHDTTTYGLYCWSKSLFEKLGWMTLAHQDCHLIQLKCYVENINILTSHIETKLEFLHNLHKKSPSSHELENNIHDMKILHDNVKTLKKHAEHLVKTCKKEKISKKVSGKKMMKGGAANCSNCGYEFQFCNRSVSPQYCQCKNSSCSKYDVKIYNV